MASSNPVTLQRFLDEGEIDIAPSRLFEQAPADAPPPPRPVDFDRVEGMLVGLAIGDALGYPVEGLSPAERKAAHGELRDYLPSRHAAGAAKGLPSAETQMAFWTLEHLMGGKRLNPARLAAKLGEGLVFGPGPTLKQFARHHRSGALPWQRRGLKSTGSGALSRVAPLLLPHLYSASARDGRAGGDNKAVVNANSDPSLDPNTSHLLYTDVALSTMMTHNDSAAIAAGVAWAHLLRELLAMESPPPREWWSESFVSIAKQVEIDPLYRSKATRYADFTGTLWQFVERASADARDEGWDVHTALRIWGSRSYLFESIPSTLHILAHHADDPETAIVRAVNDAQDPDTIGALVGAAVGALHGHDALPARWVDHLSGRTRADDDGRVFALLAEAGRVFAGL